MVSSLDHADVNNRSADRYISCYGIRPDRQQGIAIWAVFSGFLRHLQSILVDKNSFHGKIFGKTDKLTMSCFLDTKNIDLEHRHPIFMGEKINSWHFHKQSSMQPITQPENFCKTLRDLTYRFPFCLLNWH